ncbi:MAG: DUF362 domain-containing protein [Candidatus Hermodarchaeota archaeon]
MKGEKLAVVSIVQDSEVGIAVRKAIDFLGGIENFVQAQDKVVIKPNLVFAVPPYTGFTTDPPVIKAIIELCQKMNPSEVIIAEGSGGIDTHISFMSCGYAELIRKYHVKLVDLNSSPTTRVEVPNGVAVKELNIPDIIRECDVLINVPKLKLYKPTPDGRDWASLAVKNLLGAVPGRGSLSSSRPKGMAVEYSREFWEPGGEYFHPMYRQWWSPRGERKRIHTNLDHGLADVNMVIKPALNLLDAFLVSNDVNMTTTRAEKSFPLNSILASPDPLALDCIAVKIGGIDPFNVGILKTAAERDVGESDYNKIQLVGTPLEKIIKTWKSLCPS